MLRTLKNAMCSSDSHLKVFVHTMLLIYTVVSAGNDSDVNTSQVNVFEQIELLFCTVVSAGNDSDVNLL